MNSAALRGATLAGVAAVCVIALRHGMRTPPVVPASAPAAEFSAERAMKHVLVITSRPRPSGSAGHAAVRDYVVAELKALGLEPQIQVATGVGTRYPVAGHVQNILARVSGTTIGPAVLLVVHYDGVPAGPAAGDDASGTAALLETLRALRAGSPLRNDVIALFTDSEESGLLGAAAFVREHPMARNAGVVLNFEARGVSGPSFMFETGQGNRDVVSVLRRVPGTRATSLSTTVYRRLPNDTDLSELSVLGLPAMNFAFIGDVARYHTTEDDAAHLDRGSVQHHGEQMLGLAREFGNEPLPRPKTGDAVFFFLPLVGLVYYPTWLAMPLAFLGAGLALVGLVRARRAGPALVTGKMLLLPALAGALSLGVGVAVGTGLLSFHVAIGSGSPRFSGMYLTGVALLAAAVALLAHAMGDRSNKDIARPATLVWWNLVSLIASRVAGFSFLFTWPALVAAGAHLIAVNETSTRRRVIARRIADALTVATVVFLIVPVAHAMVGVALGLDAVGGGLVGFLIVIAASLAAPTLDWATGSHPFRAAGVAAATGAIAIAAGMATVRTSAAAPTGATIVYNTDADSGGAWLTGGATGLGLKWYNAVQAAARDSAPLPQWIAGRYGRYPPTIRATAARLAGPTATVLKDSTGGAERRVLLRIRPAAGNLSVALQADGGSTGVTAAAIDGRPIDKSRYRRTQTMWALEFVAPPDSGFTLALTLARDAKVVLRLTGRSPGFPPLPGVTIPPRPAGVIPIQSGDVTQVHRRLRL